MGDVEQAPVTIKAVGDIGQIDAAQWDACAGGHNPFLSHAFLKALEQSGSVRAETGWVPYHVVVEDAEEKLRAAAPLYVKSHSMGEYMFDYGWADAFERAGGRYYPKLQLAVPFTPVTGPRLLARDDGDREVNRELALAGCVEVARQLEVSSLHVTFLTEEEWKQCGASGLLQRTGEQFHWLNKGYAAFDDFLADLTSRKRKQIRRERREIHENSDIDVQVFTGDDLTEEHWDAFFAFYVDTGSRKWGRPYLNRLFFSLVGETMADRVALVMASREGNYIAGALNFIGSDALYGRNWGCREDHRFLHFTTRRSSSPSNGAWIAWRQAPRDRTNSPGVICPCTPIQRTGYASPGSGTRSSIISSTSASRSTRTSPTSPPTRLSGIPKSKTMGSRGIRATLNRHM